MAENISDPKLNEYAVDTVNDINFDEFMDEKLEEIHWLSTLARIQEQTDEYIVAAPVCYMATDSLEEKNVTFLKLERDIDEPELNLGVDAARFAMKSAYNRKLPLEATGQRLRRKQ